MRQGGPVGRAGELIAEARVAFHRGDNDLTRRLATEALDLARGARDDASASVALTWLARVALRDGDFVTQRRLANEALASAQRTSDVAAAIGPLHLIAASDRMEGDFVAARRGYERTRELSHEVGNTRMALVETVNLAAVELLARDAEAARLHGQEALRETLDEQRLAAVCLSILGGAAVAMREWERGARLLGAAEGLIARAGTLFDPDDGAEHDARVASASAALGARYEAHARAGRGLTNEAAFALALT